MPNKLALNDTDPQRIDVTTRGSLSLPCGMLVYWVLIRILRVGEVNPKGC